MRTYIDADVLIWHFRGEKKARNLLVNLRDQDKYDLYTGAMQRKVRPSVLCVEQTLDRITTFQWR